LAVCDYWYFDIGVWFCGSVCVIWYAKSIVFMVLDRCVQKNLLK
jgi:hypothetical protein